MPRELEPCTASASMSAARSPISSRWTSGPHHPGQSGVDPGRPVARRARRPCRLAGALGHDRAALLARHRPHRPRHHGRDQRAARAQGRQGRPADHRGPSRRHRDARGAEGRSLQPAPCRRPSQLVPRARRLGVRERMRADGRVETPLDQASLDAAIATLPGEPGCEAVAVCYLHAYRDPRHERATAEAVARRAAGRLRFALLGGAAADQGVRAGLDDRRQRLCRPGAVSATWPARARGSRGRATRPDLLIIQSHGGVAPIAEAVRLAAGAVLSGPAGGVAGSVYAAPAARRRQPDPFDMGGTAPTSALVVGGEAGARVGPPRRRPAHRAAAASTSPASAPAAARSRASTPAACCMSARRAPGRDAGPGLLWPRRHRGDRHRRQPRARLPRPRELSRRPPGARSNAPPNAPSIASPAPARHRPARRGATASTASSTPTWPRASGSSRCAAASIRAVSRCSRSAAPPGCT